LKPVGRHDTAKPGSLCGCGERDDIGGRQLFERRSVTDVGGRGRHPSIVAD
jgi:hypothetical protein